MRTGRITIFCIKNTIGLGQNHDICGSGGWHRGNWSGRDWRDWRKRGKWRERRIRRRNRYVAIRRILRERLVLPPPTDLPKAAVILAHVNLAHEHIAGESHAARGIGGDDIYANVLIGHDVHHRIVTS